MSLSDTEHQQYQQVLQRLLSERKTLQLATQGDAGPEASYAPFVYHEGGFYLYVSELAGHTRNLLRQPQAGVMLIEDEQQSRNLFARQRATFQCRVEVVLRSDDRYQPMLDQMADQLGNTIDLLRTLSDFHLLHLIPQQGRLVVGFGKAMTVSLPAMTLAHIDADAIRRDK